MFKKSIFIVVPVIAVIALIFAFGIITYNSKYEVFQTGGHIIAKSSNATTEKFEFDADSKYKTVNEEVIITTVDNESFTIPTETFIHYANGDLSTFSKSVVLDLNDLDKENYTYYNVFPGTVFRKTSSAYSVNYLDKQLNFTNFMLKISNDKFMIIGPNLKLIMGENSKTIDNSYLEVTYLDGNVIRIENHDVSFQSVSDEVMIEVGEGVIIDFVGKNIYKDQQKKISLGEITIDSDDNIQISADENKFITGKEPEEGEEGKSGGSSGGSGGGTGSGGKRYTAEELPDVSTGIVDTTTDSLEQIVDENARIKDAEFKVVNLDVTANRIRSEVQITDEDGVLTGDIVIKIIETNTNKVVYETTDDSGSNIISIEYEALEPETNYILVVNSDYEKNDMTYNKDFIQKTFITDAIGVSLEKYYVSENELQVNIKKSSYSDVVSVDIALEDNDERTLRTQTIELENEDNIVDFTELTHDTRYKVRVYNFIYKEAIISDGFTILKSYETLKKKPTIGSTTFVIDKKESKFNMMINNMSDPDGGIVSYRYEVYDARTVSEDNATPITIVEKNNTASATIKVDGTTFERGTPYVFRVVMTFNDNEKEYDYSTDFSEAMKLDGVVFPIVSFTKTNVTFERIVGVINILDEGNTIDLAGGSIITVTYTDSVGTSNSFTTSGSLQIPIDINNLRSNETYSFSINAKVDLQDGNPVIDNCYIGSVIVKTEDPNPFVMSMTALDTSNSTFRVSARLSNGGEGSTELEANTLTGLTFNLYQGKTTSGKLVKTVKRVDRNLAPYESDLRTSFYDQTFIIDSLEFFEMRNSDLKSEYYTIEVTSAYDYTIYQNIIPIKNNTITVRAKEAEPDGPDNPDDAIEYTPIRNRDKYGTSDYRTDLLEPTVVGYRFRAIFNNEQRYAQKFIYKIFDLDGNLLNTIESPVDASGAVPYVTISLGDGLEGITTDGTLRRGFPFYITYTAELKYSDGRTAEYPSSGVTLRSATLEPQRQLPTFKFYPSSASDTQYTWKYMYSDVDHALIDKNVTAILGGTTVGNAELELTNTYKPVTFDVSESGIFEIRGSYNLVNQRSTASSQLVSHYYEGVTGLDFGNVAFYPENNRVIFSFLKYESNQELFTKISAVKIDFETAEKTVTVDGLSAKTGQITINYSLIEDLIGKTITPKVTVYYDSGIYGFDNTGDSFAIQQLRPTDNDALYYYTFENRRWNTSDTADKSYVSYTYNLTNKKISIYDKVTETNAEYDIEESQYGLSYSSTYFSPKKLNETIVSTSGDTSFSFDTIIPGVSVLDESNISTISALINTAEVKITAFGINGKVKDDKIYLELYKTLDQTGTEATLEKTLEFDLAELNNILTIEDLLPETNYYFRIAADIKKSDGTYTRSYLYDVNQQREGVYYYFKTIGNVGITDLTVKYDPENYANRRINISYNLGQKIGYSYITYKVYKIISEATADAEAVEELLDLDYPTELIFKNEMSNYITIPNTSGFVTGEKYRIEVQPVLTTTVQGEETNFELESGSVIYRFNRLYNPYFSVKSGLTNGNATFRVNIKDYHKVIVNGKYKIQILDENGNDITPSSYADQEYSIYTINKQFNLTGVQSEKEYTFKVLYASDLYNNVDLIESTSYNYTTKFTQSSSIGLGSIYADTNTNDNTKVVLRFFESINLTNAKRIRYSIYSENGFSIDNTVSFVPTLKTDNGTEYYEFMIPDSINNKGIYYISMQFLDANESNTVILAEDTVEYRYL